jgi:Pyridine nucleotide-disulphide oxidoreductase/NADH:flavin oxidoreductase / NADH oxidase family
VLGTVRAAIGAGGVLGLRLSCDELAPWAGVTPEAALDLAAELTASGVDYLVVTRGSIYSVEQTRPDHHQPAACNGELARAVAGATAVPVVAQGSIVDPVDAEWMVADDGGRCAGVEMTRAQIADPDLVEKLRRGAANRIRPCTRCNQTCQVRDVRNPLVTCIGEPTSGRETEDPDWYAAAAVARRVTVVGGGVAGLEVARVAARRGHAVRVVERDDHLGGMAAAAGPNAALVRWLQAEVALDDRVSVELGAAMADVEAAEGEVVVQCTGGRAGDAEYVVGDGVRPCGRYTDVGTLRLGDASLPDAGDVVLIDPIGGPIAVALAEELGPRAILVTPDHIAGNELSRSGDLAPANVRLARAGVRIERRCLVRAVRLLDGGQLEVSVADRFGEGTRTIVAAAVVDCGFRLPTEPLRAAAASAGDCIAPRTVHEAILDARRVALSL